MYATRKFLNHFKTFNIPQKFNIDVGVLKRNYIKLQQEYHPDVGVSEEKSAEISTGYNILKKPIERGLYLVKLTNPDKTLEELPSPSDIEFLMTIMELNEEMSQLKTKVEYNDFKSKLLKTQSELLSGIEVAFEENNIDTAYELLAQLKYFESLNTRLLDIDL